MNAVSILMGWSGRNSCRSQQICWSSSWKCKWRTVHSLYVYKLMRWFYWNKYQVALDCRVDSLVGGYSRRLARSRQQTPRSCGSSLTRSPVYDRSFDFSMLRVWDIFDWIIVEHDLPHVNDMQMVSHFYCCPPDQFSNLDTVRNKKYGILHLIVVNFCVRLYTPPA